MALDPHSHMCNYNGKGQSPSLTLEESSSFEMLRFHELETESAEVELLSYCDTSREDESQYKDRNFTSLVYGHNSS